MRLFKDWRFVLFISILFIFLSLFYVFFADFQKLPDEGWSKGLIIDEFSVGRDFEDYYYNDQFATAYHDKIIYVYYADNNIYLNEKDVYGTTLKETVIENVGKVTDINGHIKNDILTLSFHDLTTSNIHNYEIDLTDASISLIKSYPVTENFYLGSDHFSYLDDGTYFINDYNRIYELPSQEDVRLFNFATAIDNDTIYVAEQYNNGSVNRIDVSSYDKTNGQVDVIFSEIQESSGATKGMDCDVSFNDEEIMLFSSLRNDKYGTTFLDVYAIDKKTQEFQLRDYMLNNYTTNMTLLDEGQGEYHFLMSQLTDTGIGDLSSSAEMYSNIVKVDFYTGASTILTKTNAFSNKPLFIHIGDYDYLLFSEVALEDGTALNKVYLSSNNPEIIEMSKNISLSEFMGLFLTTLTTFIPVLFFGIQVIVKVALPSLIFVVLLMMAFMSWSERNPKKALLYTVVFHMVVKSYNFFVELYPMAIEGYFQSNLMVVLPYFILSGLSLLILKLYLGVGGHSNRSAAANYIFFMVVDLLLYVLFYYPYTLL